MFGNRVRLFCSENDLILSSETHLPGGTFTHYSEAWHTTSWLDHCISTSDGDEIINSISIDYSLNNADHLPVCIDLALQRIPEIVVDNSTRQRGLAWDKINDDDRAKYCDLSDANLLRIPIPHDALRCIDANCTNVNHRNDLNKFYDNITESMSKASEAIFDNKGAGTNRRNGTHSVPGWNEHVNELHNIARQSFLEWIVEGKPKHGTVFDDMKLSRARFKYELRCLKRHKDQQIGDSLANKLQDSKPEHFWKEINRINKCKVTLPNCIDGVTGANNICELWKNHFHQLLNCIQDDDALHVDVIYSSEMIITVDEIEVAISQLGKKQIMWYRCHICRTSTVLQ